MERRLGPFKGHWPLGGGVEGSDTGLLSVWVHAMVRMPVVKPINNSERDRFMPPCMFVRRHRGSGGGEC